MAIHDPIADGLTKIRNASRAKHQTVDVPSSRVFDRLLEVLKREGFIRTYKSVGDTPVTRRLRVYLKYTPAPVGQPAQAGGKTPAITQLIRISKPGMRVYRKAGALPRVLNGLGVAVVSTSKGLLTDHDAYRQRIGGEVMCYVW